MIYWHLTRLLKTKMVGMFIGVCAFVIGMSHLTSPKSSTPTTNPEQLITIQGQGIKQIEVLKDIEIALEKLTRTSEKIEDIFVLTTTPSPPIPSPEIPSSNRLENPNVDPENSYPSGKFSTHTEANCPPSCPTRDLRKARPVERDTLSADQIWDFNEKGYTVLEGLFSHQEVDAFNLVVDNIIKARKTNETAGNIVMDWGIHTPGSRRSLLKDVPDLALNAPFKINDLYLRYPEVRAMALDPRITRALAELLDFKPVMMNSLNFVYGSTQVFHMDTWYMPPPSSQKMVAIWIALDDVTHYNGPLRYWPGSHKIKPYRFPNGRLNQPAGGEWREGFDNYINAEIAKRNITMEEFHAKKGDVLIWHAQLYHGGSPILDGYQSTRRSLVCHYYSALDYVHDGVRVRAQHGNGYYHVRPYVRA
eukprot:CAMPEP_0197517902 /NCGR_PEP_ID=MMETSP1318-20131121/2980_1 /TAXON_ID=552666 /ORGANISM="Partenskyella glossopodia, Strain RCC365" /LENGTH=418 /DNA_ID=CAMNT_0043067831 /DNA_START=51 /DNA_END=1307 /DNA_ORIENTATION=-